MDAGTQSELDDLRFHWDTAYDITHDGTRGVWAARFRGSDDELTGSTCHELRQAIRDDYQERRRAELRLLAQLQERSST